MWQRVSATVLVHAAVARVGANAVPVTPAPAQCLLGGVCSSFPVERGEEAQPNKRGCGLLEELGKLHLLVESRRPHAVDIAWSARIRPTSGVNLNP